MITKTKRGKQHPDSQQVHNTICYYNKWVMGLTRSQQHESWEYETHKNFNVYISITWGKCKWKWYSFCWFFFARAKNASLWTWSGHIKVMTRVRLLYQCITMDYWESINGSKETHFLAENTSGHTNFHKELSKKAWRVIEKKCFERDSQILLMILSCLRSEGRALLGTSTESSVYKKKRNHFK